MNIVPMTSSHLARIRLQPAQAWCRPHLTDDLMNDTVGLGGFTALVGDEPIACAGLMEFWTGRAMAWSFIGAQAGSHMIALTRAVRDHLEGSPYRRIEAYVDEGFDAGHRWVGLLGFEAEGLLRAFLPDGRNQVLYSKVKHG